MSHTLRRGHNGIFGKGMVDFAGRQGHASVFGELVVGSHIDDISIQYQYNNSTRDVSETVTGTGAASNADSMAQVSSGAGVGLAELESVESIRYRPGHEAYAQMTFQLTGLGAGVSHFIGIGNGDDRIGVGSKDGVVGIWFREGGNPDTFVPQSDWEVDKLDGSKGEENRSGFELDATKLNIVMPSYGWLGSAPIIVSFYAGWGLGWVVAHVIDISNSENEPHLDNPTLPLKMEVERTSGAGEATVRSSSWRGGSIAGSGDEADSAIRVFNYTSANAGVPGAVAIPANTPTAFIVIKNKATFQGKTNHVKARPILLSFVTDGTKDVLIQGVKGATTSVAANFVDTDAANSVMQFADNVPLTVTAPDPIPPSAPATFMGKVDAREVDAERRRVVVYPGEELYIIATSTNSSEVSATVTVEELF